MSGKKISVLLFVVGIILIFSSVLWFILSQQFGSASLTVDSVPEANVYVDGQMVGKTPYSGEFKAGEVAVKLIPLAFDSPRIPFEAKVKLVAGVDTVVRRSLGETQLDSSGEIISFEKSGGNQVSVTVVTTPDNAQVTLDGLSTEYSPVRFDDVDPSRSYSLTIRADGYEEKIFSIAPQKGYTLTAIVNLAKNEKPEVSENPQESTSSELKKTEKVVILSTPVGFLRVRTEESTNSPEVSQVKPGEEYELLETSSDGKWYKIKLLDESLGSGWISSEYAEIKED